MKIKYVLDYSILCADPGTRGLTEHDEPGDVMNDDFVDSLSDLGLKMEIQRWLNTARLGDFKDFGPFTIFLRRSE